MFVAGFLAVGKRSAFRSLLGAALRSALGCKNVAAPGGASAVQSFKAAENQRKSVLVFEGRVRWECVRLLCLVSAHLCGVGLPASARSLRQNWGFKIAAM